jgi:hypothetical protein
MMPTITSSRGILVPVSSGAYPMLIGKPQGYLHIPYTLFKRMLASNARADEITPDRQIPPRVARSPTQTGG